MDVEKVAISSLTLDPKNPRRGNVQAIADSLSRFGQHRPAVVQRGTNKVLVGNHMIKAAMAIGWDEITVTYVDDDDETAIRRAIADNATGDQASWDDQQLASLLEEVGSDIPGIDDKMAERLHRLLHPEDEEEPIFPILKQPGEEYDYVLVVCENVLDQTWLDNLVGLGKVRSYKDKSVGRSKVIFVDQLRKIVEERAAMLAKASDIGVAEGEQ